MNCTNVMQFNCCFPSQGFGSDDTHEIMSSKPLTKIIILKEICMETSFYSAQMSNMTIPKKTKKTFPKKVQFACNLMGCNFLIHF